MQITNAGLAEEICCGGPWPDCGRRDPQRASHSLCKIAR